MSRAERSVAPGASDLCFGPKLTPETILTLARARAVTALLGANLAGWLAACADGSAAGEVAAMRSNKGPIIGDMVTKMKGHGYPLVKHCSKMERS